MAAPLSGALLSQRRAPGRAFSESRAGRHRGEPGAAGRCSACGRGQRAGPWGWPLPQHEAQGLEAALLGGTEQSKDSDGSAGVRRWDRPLGARRGLPPAGYGVGR